MGELLFESILNSNIDSIIDFNIGNNRSWFKHPGTKQERPEIAGILSELITKQTEL